MFAEGARMRLYVPCASLVDCLAAPWPGRGCTGVSSAVGGDIAAGDKDTLRVHCMSESENGGIRRMGLDREADNSQDTGPMVKKGTRKRDRLRGIDHVRSSKLICRGAEVRLRIMRRRVDRIAE